MENSNTGSDHGTNADESTQTARYTRADGDRELERRIEVTDDGEDLTVRFYAAGDGESFDRTFEWDQFVSLLASVEESTFGLADDSFARRSFVDGEIDPQVIGRDPGPKEPAPTDASSVSDDEMDTEVVGRDPGPKEPAPAGAVSVGDGDQYDRLAYETVDDEERGGDGATGLALQRVAADDDGSLPAGGDGGWTVTADELRALLTPGATDDDAVTAAEGFSEAFRRALFVYRDEVVVRALL